MRLFVGVELDDRVKAAAADVAERLRQRLQRSPAGVDARWIAPPNLHITVWFIGEVKDDGAEAIVAALRPAFSTPAFELHVRGCGAFPPSGAPRVFWLGLASGARSLVRIYDEVSNRLVPLGLEPQKRAYSPHLTIARIKDARRGTARLIRDALAALPADCGSCRVTAVTLFRSRLSPKGASYEPVQRVPLS
jgi:RNA 2',3'-cyclic 3'-phosphodiesterase